MMQPYQSSLGQEQHRLHHREMIAEADARRLARRTRTPRARRRWSRL